MPAIRLVLLGVAFALALVVASLMAEPGGWSDTVRWAAARSAALAERAPTCPVLVGAPLAGRPHDAYEDAARLAAGIDAEIVDALRRAVGDEALERDAAHTLVAGLPAAALARIREATRTGGPVFDPTQLGREDIDALTYFDLLPLVDGLLLIAQHDPEPQPRLDALCDALACGVDLAGHEAPLVATFGAMIVGRVADAVGDGWLRRESRTSLASLAGVLATADAAFLPEEQPAAMAITFVRCVERGVRFSAHDLGMATRLQAWRQAFSLDAAALARARKLADLVRSFEAEAPPGEPWPLRSERLRRLDEVDAHNTSDVAFRDLGGVLERERARRGASARLRLLRLCVSFHLGVELPRLDDPLGDGPLASQVADRVLRVGTAGGEIEREAVR